MYDISLILIVFLNYLPLGLVIFFLYESEVSLTVMTVPSSIVFSESKALTVSLDLDSLPYLSNS